MSGRHLPGAEYEDQLASDWHLRPGALAETNAAGGAWQGGRDAESNPASGRLSGRTCQLLGGFGGEVL